MARTHIEVYTAVVLDEHTRFSFTELCRCSGARSETVRALVEEGLLTPRGGSIEDWEFPGTALARVRTAQHLLDDLGLNPPGVALALELLDELHQLRARLQRLDTPGH